MKSSETTPPDTNALRRALAAIQDLRTRLEAAERRGREPIAIVGVGCRLPGPALDPEAYWDMLSRGISAVTEVTPDRWTPDPGASIDDDQITGIYARHGAFVRDLRSFDARFFEISPREATTMDPQHRLLLEVSWEALENAAINPAGLHGERVGVFVGIAGSDYQYVRLQEGGGEGNPYVASAAATSIAAGRLSYFFGIHGPAISVDTACSSSLVSIHAAAQSLRLGECDMALAGGVAVALSPVAVRALCQARMLSPQGLCRTFDAEADGYVRGEGCGILVLKRLSTAVAAGDRILGVIRGSAVNQDGRSSGLTAPNGKAQEALLRATLQDAGIGADAIGYIEAHGTGTRLGDPIELRAIEAVFGAGMPAAPPLYVGSVKTNIGHLEAAAGVASVIKVLGTLQRGEIFPHLHFRTPNPAIDWQDGRVRVPTAAVPWAPGGAARVAGVSSFGYSGTNAHLLIEEPPPVAPRADTVPDRCLLTLSARTPDALAASARRLDAHLAAHADRLDDVCYSLAVGRASFQHRAAIVAGSIEEARDRLQELAAGNTVRVPTRAATSEGKPRIAFLYTGQGAQYAGMGRQLFESTPVFRDALQQCDALLDPIDGRRLLAWLFDESPEGAERIHRTGYAQPALFCFEYALTRLWESWGIEPVAIAGHSVGEIAAACAAGAMPLADGLRLIGARARLMESLPGGGGMLAVRSALDAIAEDVANQGGAIGVAAINGPDDVVLSGPSVVLEELAMSFRARGLTASMLRVSHAFHSPLMQPIVEEFRRVAASLSYAPPRRRLISNLTGTPLGPADLDANYWCRHLLEPVRFAASMETLHALKIDVFLEVGPHPVLLGMASRGRDTQRSAWVPSVRRGHHDRASVLAALGEIYLRGARYDARAVALPSEPRKVALPTYPFDRQRLWLDSPPRAARASSGVLRSATTGEVLLQEEASVAAWPWLDEHRVHGNACFPAAGYVALARKAFDAAGGAHGAVRTLAIEQPLMFEPETARLLQVVLTPDGPASHRCAVFVSTDRHETGWQRLATCQVGSERASSDAGDGATDVARRCTEAVDLASIYAEIEAAGVSYGPVFRPLRSLTAGEGEVVATMAVPTANGQVLEPALFDAAVFQVVGAAWMTSAGDARGGDTFLPVGVDRVEVRPLDGIRLLTCHARLRAIPKAGDTMIVADVRAWSESGALVLEADGVSARRAPRAALARAMQGASGLLYEVAWRTADPLPGGDLAGTRWLVFADPEGSGPSIVENIVRASGGATCVLPASLAASTSFDRITQALEAARAGGVLRGVVMSWDAHPAGDVPARAHALADTALALVQCAAGELDAGRPPLRVIIATRGAAGTDLVSADGLSGAPLWGLVRAARSERPDLDLQLLDVEGQSVSVAAAVIAAHLAIDDQVEWQSIHRDGVRRVPRLVRRRDTDARERIEIPDAPYQLETDVPGVLDGLRLSPMPTVLPGPGEVQIEVSASGLNFRDVLNALGAYPGGGPLGSEVAGRVLAVGPGTTRVVPGDRVMAITARAFCSHVVTPETFVRRIPASCTDEDAATIPAAFLTVEHALRTVGRLAAGERILIHAAAGGVGMAAVRLARELGAEVFATAGSDTKRRILREMGVAHVMDSRALTFADEIRRVTAGEGIDVVLNSLTGEAIDRGFSVLRAGGRFLEIGKAEWRDPRDVEARWPGIRYVIVDLTQVIREQPHQIGTMLDHIGEALAAQRLEPLPKRLFGIDQARDAFRFMAQAKHVGKVVICHRPPPGRCRPDATYLVTGGAGALGLQMGRWLVDRGAKHVVLSGRSAPSSRALEDIAELAGRGADVRFEALDVTRRDQVAAFLRAIPADRLLRGVIHAAGRLDDGVVAEMTPSRLAAVMAPKVDGAWHLHDATSAGALDFFVLFSSSAGVFGSPGQANYAAANTFLDAIAHHRHSRGLAALAIDWGPWAASGMAARLDARDRTRLQSTGVRPLDPERAADALDEALGTRQPQLAGIDMDWPALAAALGTTGIPPVLSELVSTAASSDEPRAGDPRADAESFDLSHLPAEERPGRLRAYIGEHLRVVLALATDAPVQPDDSFVELGMDSLTAVELRNRVQRGLGLQIPVAAVMTHGTLASLAEHILGVSSPDAGAPDLGADGRETLDL